MQGNCPRCSSERIARGVDLLDHIGDWGVRNSPAEARVFGKDGFLFRNSVTGQVTLDVCGDCGNADITVSNYREIYDTYIATRSDKR